MHTYNKAIYMYPHIHLPKVGSIRKALQKCITVQNLNTTYKKIENSILKSKQCKPNFCPYSPYFWEIYASSHKSPKSRVHMELKIRTIFIAYTTIYTYVQYFSENSALKSKIVSEKCCSIWTQLGVICELTYHFYKLGPYESNFSYINFSVPHSTVIHKFSGILFNCVFFIRYTILDLAGLHIGFECVVCH